MATENQIRSIERTLLSLALSGAGEIASGDVRGHVVAERDGVRLCARPATVLARDARGRYAPTAGVEIFHVDGRGRRAEGFRGEAWRYAGGRRMTMAEFATRYGDLMEGAGEGVHDPFAGLLAALDAAEAGRAAR